MKLTQVEDNNMLLLDANIFLEVELARASAQECIALLSEIRDGKRKALLSDFTIDTMLITMERQEKAPGDLKIFLLSLLKYQGLMIYRAGLFDRIRALDHIPLLDLEDSLTLQCGIQNHCTAIVSFDKDFDKIHSMKRMTPAQALAVPN